MIDADIDPSPIQGYVIYAVWRVLPQFWNLKIVNPYLFRITLRAKFPTTILEIADQLLFLGVN